MQILIFGTGHYYKYYKDCFSNVDIVGLLDNNALKQGKVLDGLRVYSPEDGIKLPHNQVYLLCANPKPMRVQLLELGEPAEKIFTLQDIEMGLKNLLPTPELVLYEKGKKASVVSSNIARNRIVIITPNLEINGAEVAAHKMATILRNIGRDILFVTLCDGGLRTALTEDGFSVVVIKKAAYNITLKDFPFLEGAKLYVINCVTVYRLLRERFANSRMLWWLHDSHMVYEETNVDDCTLQNIDLNGIDIFAVSDIAVEAFCKHYGRKATIGKLCFGLDDWNPQNLKFKTNNRSFTFAFVGYLSHIKAPDIFVAAVMKLPEGIRQNCRFFLIGDGTESEMGRMLKQQAKDYPEIMFLGELSREKIKQFYTEEIDVLVCPSREESLSIVTIEAMMFSKPVIVTDKTGIAFFVKEADCGNVVKSENVEELKDAMMWIYEHKSEREIMGKKGRLVYEKYFTVQTFEENIKQIMKQYNKKNRSFLSFS